MLNFAKINCCLIKRLPDYMEFEEQAYSTELARPYTVGVVPVTAGRLLTQPGQRRLYNSLDYHTE